MHRGFLVDLATDVIKLIGSLSPIPPVDDVGLRQRFLDLLAEFHAGGVRAGYATELVDAARYALVSLIDERVVAVDAAIATTWKKSPLHQHLSGQGDAANGFHERLAALRPPGTAERADALEVFHLCLCFGVRGRFRDTAEEPARAALIADLAREIISARGGIDAPLSPVWEARTVTASTTHPGRWYGVPLWAMPLALVVLLLLWWLMSAAWTSAALTRLANDFPVP
jgi:type VI secretion system protein ImpK